MGRPVASQETGATVWLTGFPAAGKTTLAVALEQRLCEMGVMAILLDGDELRRGLNADLGFSAADRSESVRRTANVARLVAGSGVMAVVSLVSPYAVDRDRARTLHADAGLTFVEVFVDTPLEECERRDPKGLYAQARAGRLPTLTGIGDPYEPPRNPDLTVRPAPVARGVEALVELLQSRRSLAHGGAG